MSRRVACGLALLCVGGIWGGSGTADGRLVSEAPSKERDASAYRGPALRGETLAEGLPSLGAAHGETLRSGANAAMRRFVVFPGARPLPEIMRQLKAFVGRAPGATYWYRDGSGRRISTFDEDRKSREARAAAGRRVRAELRAKRVARLRDMLEWTAPEPRDDSFPEKSRHRLSHWLRLFQALPAEAREAALDGRGVMVAGADLTPSARALLQKVARFPDPTKVTVDIFPAGTPDAPGLTVMLRRLPGGGPAMPDLLNRPRYGQDGSDWRHHYRKYRERDRGPAGRDSIPELQQRITLQGELVVPVLEELAADTGLPVLAEYDPCYGLLSRPPNRYQERLDPDKVRGLQAWQALDTVCRTFDLDWDFHEGWVRIRSPRTVLLWAGLVNLDPPTPR